jgi:AraC-like DNA-binding protein
LRTALATGDSTVRREMKRAAAISGFERLARTRSTTSPSRALSDSQRRCESVPGQVTSGEAIPCTVATRAADAEAPMRRSAAPPDRVSASSGSPIARGTIGTVTRPPSDAQRLQDLAWLRRVRDRIDREYAQPLDVEALARGAHMSAGHLSRQFKAAYGESPYSYLMTRRIERAMALLRDSDLSVTDVCWEVGCSSLGTFSTRFTELVGVPPSVYRERAAHTTAGMPPCVAKQVTRPIRNREAVLRTAP